MKNLGVWVCAVLCVLLAGAPSRADSEPADAHVLRVPLNEMPRSLDPAHAQGAAEVLCVINIYDQLYEARYGARPYALDPCLADGLPQLSDGGRTVTIRLKRGVRYADDACFPQGKGRMVTAADVVFCIKRLMDPRTRSSGSWTMEGHILGLDTFAEHVKLLKPGAPYPDVAGLRVVDTHTIRMHLTQPWPQLAWALCSAYSSIYPPEAVAHHGRGFATHPVTSGAYTLRSYDPKRGFVLEANPDHRSVGTRKSRVTRVEGRPFDDPEAMWEAFVAGELDLCGIPKDVFGKVVDTTTMGLRQGLVEKGIHLHGAPMAEIIYDAFNMRDPVLGEPAGSKGRALRRAMSLASDRDWSRKNLYDNRAVPVGGILIPDFLEHDATFVNPWQRGPKETREQALARARKLLSDAGFPGSKGVPVIRKHIIESEISRVFFLVYKRDLAEVGLRVEAVPVAWPEFLRVLNRGEAQTWGVSWGADYPDAQNFLQLFYGPNVSPGVNKANFKHAEFDRLYAEAAVLAPCPRRTELYRRMQAIVVHECPWSLRFRRVRYTAVGPRLQEFQPSELYPKYFQYCTLKAQR